MRTPPPHLTALLTLIVLLGPARATAQPSLNFPGYSVAAVASGLAESGRGMAVDRFGNVYITDEMVLAAGVVLSSITRVRPDGTVDQNHVANLGQTSELAFNPADGLVYVMAAGIAAAGPGSLLQIDPAGGAVTVNSFGILASGLTFDDQGRAYLGDGSGIYQHDPALAPGNLLLLDPGHGDNSGLQWLANGHVLVASGNEVRRFVPGVAGTAPHYSFPICCPNEFANVHSMARNPFNRFGTGALIGVRHVVTVSGGTGLAIATDPAGGTTILFASQPFNIFFSGGFAAIASGHRRDLYWLSSTNPAGSVLWRIVEGPHAGGQGTLLATTAPGQVTLDLWGAPAGGEPFTLGAMASPPPASAELFVPGLGTFVELLPFHPSYIPLIDGIGLLGAPDPAGVFPITGHVQITAAVPPALSGLTFDLQSLVPSPLAPNALFFVSNLETVTLP